jgi:hypothetical protein
MGLVVNSPRCMASVVVRLRKRSMMTNIQHRESREKLAKVGFGGRCRQAEPPKGWPHGRGVPSGGLVNLRFLLQNFREKSLIPHIQRLE